MSSKIQIGQELPNVKLHLVNNTGVTSIHTKEFFANKKTILFGLPGAFTPVCTSRHLPDYALKAQYFFDKGVHQIVCISVNDSYVMEAWGKSLNILDKVSLLADGNGEFTEAIGLSIDLSSMGYGKRSRRYSAIVEDNKLCNLQVEEEIDSCNVSSEQQMEQLM